MSNIWDSWWHHLSSKGFEWLFPFSNATSDTGGLSPEHTTSNTFCFPWQIYQLPGFSYTLGSPLHLGHFDFTQT